MGPVMLMKLVTLTTRGGGSRAAAAELERPRGRAGSVELVREEDLFQVADSPAAGHRSLPSSIGSVQLVNGARGPALLLDPPHGASVVRRPVSAPRPAQATGQAQSQPGQQSHRAEDDLDE